MVTVFIIASHLMFSRGLERLLRQESTLRIVGLEQDGARAVKQIRVRQPDVVIMYGNDKSNDFKVTVVDVLNISPHSKVIGLNLQNNISFIYQATRWVTEDVSGLVDVINSQSSGPRANDSKESVKA